VATLDRPLVSIIVNCFNGEKYLRDALQSVLKQTYKNWELIFWDNKSFDNSKKVFLEFLDDRFKYFISEKHTTLYEARNNAIKQSKGEVIALLDVDDWWIDNRRLEKQVDFFKDEKVGLIHSNFYLFYQNTKEKKIFHKKIVKSGYITRDLFKEYNIGLSTALIRKTAYISASGFNNQYNIIGDFDLFMRLSQSWKFVFVNECLSCFRIHNENFSLLNTGMLIEELEKWISDVKIISNENLRPYLYYIKKRVNFLKTKKYINEGKLIKALNNIIFYSMGFNKIKLILQIVLPKKIFKKMELYH